MPLVGELAVVPSGQVPVYVSEAMVDLYGARLGEPLPLLDAALGLPAAPRSRFTVAGVWRDYVRQSGAVLLEQADYVRLTGDRRVNDLQVWLAPGADAAACRRPAARRGPGRGAAGVRIGARDPRRVAAHLRPQLRRHLLAAGGGHRHRPVRRRRQLQRAGAGAAQGVRPARAPGLTRGQILAVVAGEGAAWTLVGALAGLALGLGVAVVLVHVVNPQSFHWTMDLLVPWLRLLALCLAVVAAGTLTAWLAGRAAAGRDAVLAVKEDW
jgi:putative ABC transport system permease protein